MHSISGFYWTYHNMNQVWEEPIIDKMEEVISNLLREELLLQKQLEHEIDQDLKEGLQTMNVYDLEVIEHYYNTDENLMNTSKRQREILKLIK